MPMMVERSDLRYVRPLSHVDYGRAKWIDSIIAIARNGHFYILLYQTEWRKGKILIVEVEDWFWYSSLCIIHIIKIVFLFIKLNTCVYKYRNTS